MKVEIIKIEGKNIEYVIEGGQNVESAELADWVKTGYVRLGSAEISMTEGKVSFCSMNQSDTDKPKEKAKEKTGKWEDDMVTFEDLLTKAHNLKAPFSIHTDMLAVDLEKKYALFKARIEVVGKDKNVAIFEGHGDATSENVTGEFIKPHFIRMAETRSIVRALRWYTNNGVAEEEKQ